MRNYCLALFLCLAGAMFSVSCSDEPEHVMGEGLLQVSLENISPSVKVRTVPGQIGVPAVERFTVSVKNARGVEVYREPYADVRIPLGAGEYTVSASYGENSLIAIDAPYYTGSTTVQVADGQVSQASITCGVGNALVSAIFGRNEEETARFDKFYESYSLRLYIGEYYGEVTNLRPDLSVYVRAGSTVNPVFFGKLRADGRTVSMPLNTNGTLFPDVFKAGTHAIVTLALPDPENVAAVDISKVQVEEATLGENIPLSWLPLPQVSATHRFTTGGNLIGTDLTFTNCYPGMEWKAEVADADGNVYRTVQGTGELSSSYKANAEGWKYMPAGTYTATYYLMQNGVAERTGSRSFTVENPALELKILDAYTSYDVYLKGDVDGANSCDPYTIYHPTLSFNVDPSLMADNRYTSALACNVNGQDLPVKEEDDAVTVYEDATGVPPNAYALTASAVFDKVSLSTNKAMTVTGMPVSFAPPTQEAWSSYGTTNWTDEFVRLGQNTTSQPQYITTAMFYVPAGVKVEAYYNCMSHGATVATTLSLLFGDYTYFSAKSSSGAFNSKDHYYEGTEYFTTSSLVQEAKANNSYGSGATCSRVYILSYKYGQ